MILFFPQYQAGAVPSNIPVGTPALRKLWQDAPDFLEVPLQPTNPEDPGTDARIRFREILKRQTLDALDLVNQSAPDFILTTGGDCGASFVPISYMNGLYKGKIGVIWVDAHADIHLPLTSPSGNYHGMVLRNLMGDDDFDINPSLSLNPRQIAYLGLQDTEREEDDIIEQSGILRFDANQIKSDDSPLENIVAQFRINGLTHLHLHVDCDVLDLKVFPHVHVPEPAGISLERLLYILQYLRREMPLASCCLTEYAPKQAGMGIDILKKIYTEGLGLALPG